LSLLALWLALLELSLTCNESYELQIKGLLTEH
jgi:hypothetical protein